MKKLKSLLIWGLIILIGFGCAFALISRAEQIDNLEVNYEKNI